MTLANKWSRLAGESAACDLMQLSSEVDGLFGTAEVEELQPLAAEAIRWRAIKPKRRDVVAIVKPENKNGRSCHSAFDNNQV